MRKPLVAIAVVIMISVNAYGYDDIKYDAVNKQLQIYDFIIPLLEDWENIMETENGFVLINSEHPTRASIDVGLKESDLINDTELTLLSEEEQNINGVVGIYKKYSFENDNYAGRFELFEIYGEKSVYISLTVDEQVEWKYIKPFRKMIESISVIEDAEVYGVYYHEAGNDRTQEFIFQPFTVNGKELDKKTAGRYHWTGTAPIMSLIEQKGDYFVDGNVVKLFPDNNLEINEMLVNGNYLYSVGTSLKPSDFQLGEEQYFETTFYNEDDPGYSFSFFSDGTYIAGKGDMPSRKGTYYRNNDIIEFTNEENNTFNYYIYDGCLYSTVFKK